MLRRSEYSSTRNIIKTTSLTVYVVKITELPLRATEAQEKPAENNDRGKAEKPVRAGVPTTSWFRLAIPT